MEYDSIERLWRSTANEPSDETRAALIGEARAALARRRAALIALLVFAAAVLGLSLTLIGLDLAMPQSEIIDLQREWALAPLTLIPVLVLMLAALRRPRPPADATVLATLQALATDNAAARTRIIVIGAAMVIFSPLIGVVLNQLVAAEKMTRDEMTSAMLALFGALSLSAFWMAARYFTRLRPEARHLAVLLGQYEQAP